MDCLFDPDPDQPRREVGDVTDLALSIRSHGLLSPIPIERQPKGRYRILGGERRFTACKSLGLASILCLVRTGEEPSPLALQIIENRQRKALTPLEGAAGLCRLEVEFQLSQRELFDQALAGTLAVHQARQSKPQSKPHVVIALGDATVTLRFEYGNPTPERIAETLKKALEADLLRSDV
jgi:ParB-like chromosome segregation protein Spo0J